jgi:hypothetical protein
MHGGQGELELVVGRILGDQCLDLLHGRLGAFHGMYKADDVEAGRQILGVLGHDCAVFGFGGILAAMTQVELRQNVAQGASLRIQRDQPAKHRFGRVRFRQRLESLNLDQLQGDILLIDLQPAVEILDRLLAVLRQQSVGGKHHQRIDVVGVLGQRGVGDVRLHPTCCPA